MDASDLDKNETNFRIMESPSRELKLKFFENKTKSKKFKKSKLGLRSLLKKKEMLQRKIVECEKSGGCYKSRKNNKYFAGLENRIQKSSLSPRPRSTKLKHHRQKIQQIKASSDSDGWDIPSESRLNRIFKKKRKSKDSGKRRKQNRRKIRENHLIKMGYKRDRKNVGILEIIQFWKDYTYCF